MMRQRQGFPIESAAPDRAVYHDDVGAAARLAAAANIGVESVFVLPLYLGGKAATVPITDGL